jgi:hypothetical protein
LRPWQLTALRGFSGDGGELREPANAEQNA